MSVPWLVDIPQQREAPEHVRRALRALDGSVEVIHLGLDRWYVGKVRPTRESVAIAQRLLADYWKLPDKMRGTIRSKQRYRFALACMQGFRPVQEYRMRELDSRVVRDFELSRAMMLRAMHQDDLTLAFEEEQERVKAESLAMLRDESRAREALKYGLTLSHSHRLRGENQRTSTPLKSGWTRHTIPA